MTDKELYMQNDNDSELDIIGFLQILWNHKIVIIVLILIFSLLMFTKTIFFTDNTYTSYGVLHISNKKEEVDTEKAIQKNDIETSKTLSTTYVEILKTRIFLKEVSDSVGEKYTWEQIGSMLTISTLNDTELLKISIKSKESSDSYLIAQTIMEKAPEKLTSIYKSGEVEVVDPPVPPALPDDKGLIKNILIGIILGFLLGVVYAFLHNLLDKKVHKSIELEKRYNISILGETAQILENKRSRKKKNINGSIDEVEKIISNNTNFDTVETYKSIRTNIMFSMPKREKGRVIIVTSASPDEGKTTTTINLAITFAQTGANVILIDCDLRKSRVHRYLQTEKKDGVSNVVCGYTDLNKAIKRNVRDNLDCLTAGEIPPNPAELLGTTEFQNMISELQQNYDYIFIDTPPITVVTDAAILMKQSTSVVIVARQEVTTFDLLDSAINEIKKTGAKILGAIVHDCNEKYKKYGYKYGHKYKYDYQYGDGPKEKM